jgi:transcriptional regulator with XRE-family HTH domain
MKQQKYSNFGQLLKKLRKEHRLTQREILNRLHKQGYESYEKSAVSKWENGYHRPPKEVVEILADILEYKAEALLGEAGYRDEAEARAKSMGDTSKSVDPALDRAKQRHWDKLAKLAEEVALEIRLPLTTEFGIKHEFFPTYYPSAKDDDIETDVDEIEYVEFGSSDVRWNLEKGLIQITVEHPRSKSSRLWQGLIAHLTSENHNFRQLFEEWRQVCTDYILQSKRNRPGKTEYSKEGRQQLYRAGIQIGFKRLALERAKEKVVDILELVDAPGTLEFTRCNICKDSCQTEIL